MRLKQNDHKKLLEMKQKKMEVFSNLKFVIPKNLFFLLLILTFSFLTSKIEALQNRYHYKYNFNSKGELSVIYPWIEKCNDASSQSICVENSMQGISLCAQYGSEIPNIHFFNGQRSSSLQQTVFTNVKIKVHGGFVFDTDMTFNNCRLEFNDSAQIDIEDELNGGHFISIIGCKVYSCNGTHGGFDSYLSMGGHSINVYDSQFENFETAFRLWRTNFNVQSSTFTGGVDYVTGIFHLESCNQSDALISFSTFNSLSGVTAINSRNSNLSINNNTFNNGKTGINSGISSTIYSESNTFNNCTEAGINSSFSTLYVSKSENTMTIPTFFHCAKGIISNRDLSINVNHSKFQSFKDIEIEHTTFALISHNFFWDPITSKYPILKTNISSINTPLNLIDNVFTNNASKPVIVTTTGGRLNANGNKMYHYTDSHCLGFVTNTTNTVLTKNIFTNAVVSLGNVTSGVFQGNELNNNLPFDSWHSINSPGGVYCENTVSSGSKGMFFDGNNMNTFLASTTFNNAQTGIEINEVLGPQVRRGNMWLGTFSNLGASYTGDPARVFLSLFTTRPLLPWRPTNFNPTNLFGFTNISTIEDCDSQILTPKDKDLTAIDLQIINNTSVWQNVANEWIAKWYLCIKLLKNPNLLSDPNFSAWFNNIQNSDVYLSAVIHYQLENLVSESENQNILALLDSYNMSNISASDYYNATASVILPIQVQKTAKMTSLLQLIDQLNGNHYMDVMVKKVYKPYIESMLDPTRILDVVEMSYLDSVAHLCPQLHGPAVYIARTFLTDTEQYDVQDIVCSQTQTRSIEAKINNAPNEPLLYPNPTTGIVQIESNIVLNQVLVYDHIGMLIRSFAPSNQIDIQDLPAGLYLITLKNMHGDITTHKVIKID